MSDQCSVKVALRIRPLVDKELSKGCQNVLKVYSELNQVQIENSDKAFTYNYVFDEKTDQSKFYEQCIASMIGNLFKGYNVTILAYGQTGSGKTHSMGTAYVGESDSGIIPRAVSDIFNNIHDNFGFDFNVTVSFMELYQEILYDLLSEKPREQTMLDIREDAKSVYIPGLTEQNVKNITETLECLIKGSQRRAVGCTNMNQQSSRSHAIFTITISMTKKDDSNCNKTSKFHLVDLAGSERSKKTGATGQTFKEGVNINKGLLSLGNVISALGEEKQTFVPYRDSSLTRILKDSLGGNSITLMIACVSPADYNLDETMTTMRYADRARKIKNKPIVNEDKKAAEINKLNRVIAQLRMELASQGGPMVCIGEFELMKKELFELKIKNRDLSLKLSSTINEKGLLHEGLMLRETTNENLVQKVGLIKKEYEQILVQVSGDPGLNMQEVSVKLQYMKELFNELDASFQVDNEEIRKHETLGALTMVGSSSEAEIIEQQEDFTSKQIAMNTELQKVSEMLAMKVDLAEQITKNHHLVDHSALVVNEAKIKKLEEEKEALATQLKTAQNPGKQNDQKRKQIQELEFQIHSLRKKVTEQARMIKLKERDEEKIKRLNAEILSMKQMKVKLIKDMRQDSERFRVWKMQRERDLSKLKDQDRRRQNQMLKMEQQHTRQQNYMKRKVEEAVSINKRLKDALAVRKAVQDQKHNSGSIQKLNQWLQQELDVFISTIDAKAALNILLEDRASLQNKLDNLKETEESEEYIQIKHEIVLRSLQISELQQKLLDCDEENRSKTRWEHIQSMADAKQALKVVFDRIADDRKIYSLNEFKLDELQEASSELKQKYKDLQLLQDQNEAIYRQDLSNIQKEYEEKIHSLLVQLKGQQRGDDLSANDVETRCTIQQEMIEGMEETIKEYKEFKTRLEQEKEETQRSFLLLEETNRALKERLSTINDVAQKSTNIAKKAKLTVAYKAIEEDLEEDMLTDNDHEDDPDWRKTPLAKRLRKLKTETSILGQSRPAVKRNSQGGCTCKTSCSNRICGCKKTGNKCSANCRCSADVCVNRSDENVENEVPMVNGSDVSKKQKYIKGQKLF